MNFFCVSSNPLLKTRSLYIKHDLYVGVVQRVPFQRSHCCLASFCSFLCHGRTVNKCRTHCALLSKTKIANMPSTRKRKAVNELPTKEKPKATTSSQPRSTNSTKPTPQYIYVLQSLEVHPGRRTSEQDLLGVYTDLKTANAAAHDWYNNNPAWLRPLTIPKHPTPEHESLRDGKYRDMPHGEGVDDDPNDRIAQVRLRHDDGLRFGTCNQLGEISVVWVERRQLDPLTIPASTRPRKPEITYLPDGGRAIDVTEYYHSNR